DPEDMQLGAYYITWRPNSSQVVSLTVGKIILWDSVTGQVIEEQPLWTHSLNLAWSPDGSLLTYPHDYQITTVALPLPPMGCTATIAAGDVPGLISAIDAANANPDPDRICLADSSTYTLTDIHNTTSGANGLPPITTDITLVGNGATIERDPEAPDFRLLLVESTGALTLENVTLTGGLASETEPGDDGGGIYNLGTLTLIDSAIQGNFANADGGGIYSDGALTLSGTSDIADNLADDDGGGIYSAGGTLTVTGATITNNCATSAGGGLYAASTTLIIHGGEIDYNCADSGGGLYLTDSPSAAQLDDGLWVYQNTSFEGGGLYISQDGQAEITGVAVTDNRAAFSAAGIWTAGVLTLTDSDVSYNGETVVPGSAGGIRAAGGTLTVVDSTLEENWVSFGSGLGAGLYVASAATASVSGGEISSNEAYNGGGLYVTGSLSLSTTVAANRARHHGGGMYVTAGTAAVTYCTFSDNIATGMGGGINNNAALQVDNTVFSGNIADDRGGAVYAGSVTNSWVYTSCIAGNSSPNTSGVYSVPTGFDATTNWWGAADGPSGSGPGSGDAVNSTVTFSPFVTTDCPPEAGAGGGQGMMSLKLLAPQTPTIPRLAPVQLPIEAAFADETGWWADGTWILDTLSGHASAPSWAVNTVPRDQESILQMTAPVELRRGRSPRLVFWEHGQIAASDRVMVEVQPEGKSDWVVVDSQTSIPGNWTQRTVNLSAYQGQTIRLRVRVGDAPVRQPVGEQQDLVALVPSDARGHPLAASQPAPAQVCRIASPDRLQYAD
ncbi:MAG TPA: hypothetical protein VMT24_18385, partial [Aggregatilineaceae bacterium]|nr:hypothetical protein [Aggregatilineaceae bacterium]